MKQVTDKSTNPIQKVEGDSRLFASKGNLLEYRELNQDPLQKVDAIEQLHAQLLLLEDVTGRLSFVTKEIKYLLRF